MLRLLVTCLAGVTFGFGCQNSDKPAPKPAPFDVGIDLPELAYGGRDVAPDAALVVVKPTAIVVDGRSIVALVNGDVDVAEKEGGALGIKIPRLTNILAQLPGGHGMPLEVGLDRTISYRVLTEVLYSAKQKQAGWKEFALLAKAHTGGAIVSIPIVLPDRAPAERGSLDALKPIAPTLEAGTGPRGKIVATPPSAGDTSLAPDVVLSKIQAAYMASLKRCYKTALKLDATTAGKLSLSFTVNATGRVIASQATGLTEALDHCIEPLMLAWRFPIPKDTAGNPTSASFVIALKLIPDGDTASAPTQEAIGAPPAAPVADADLKLIVTVSAKEIMLWSISGQEGTLQEPKLRVARTDVTAAAQVTKALAEIVQRRWAGKPRPENSRSIIFMGDGAVQMATVVEMLGAIRGTPDGGVLFPDVLLGTGFE